MTGAEIISKFETYVDDLTELSTPEELDLMNKWYQLVCDDRPWECMKKEGAGIMASTTTIALPTDFAYVLENYNYTDNSFSTEINQKPCVVFVTSGTTTQPFQVVNWSDRRQYNNSNGFCFVDLANGVIRFPYAQPSGASYSFDYKSVPTDLTLNTSPVFPARFHPMIYHGMAIDDDIIQRFDKARSYAPENKGYYDRYLATMAQWNANLQNY